jgi:hypothetical protein
MFEEQLPEGCPGPMNHLHDLIDRGRGFHHRRLREMEFKRQRAIVGD